MRPSTILVALDDSAAAAAGAEFAVQLSQATGQRCQLVHAVREHWAADLAPGAFDQISRITQAQCADARARIGAVLQGRIPAALLEELIVQVGATTDVINDIARETRAVLIVVGGKHHSLLGRWFGGSTALNLARTAAVPLLVTCGAATAVRRILVALDVSGAARPTLEAARAFALAVGAELRAISTVAPLPVMPEGTFAVDGPSYFDLCRESIEDELRPLVEPAGAPLAVQLGPAAATVAATAAAWPADLVIVGSHGKNWSQRLVLGSVTERLLNDLPASLLVVPVAAYQPAAAMAPARALVPVIG